MPLLKEDYGSAKDLAAILRKQKFGQCAGYQNKSLGKLISFQSYLDGAILLGPHDAFRINRRWWAKNFNKFIPLVHATTYELMTPRIDKTIASISVSIWSRSDKLAFFFVRADGNAMYKTFSISELDKYSERSPAPMEKVPRTYPFFPGLLEEFKTSCARRG